MQKENHHLRHNVTLQVDQRRVADGLGRHPRVGIGGDLQDKDVGLVLA